MRETPEKRTKAVLSASDVNIFAQPISTDRERAWPFTPEDATRLAWRPTLPTALLRDPQALLVHVTLDKIDAAGGSCAFGAALRGNTAAAIAVAFLLMPIGETTLEIDLAMMVVLHVAPDGDTAAALVLSDVLGRAEQSLCNPDFGVLARPSPQSLPQSSPLYARRTDRRRQGEAAVRIQIFSDLHLDVRPIKPITVMRGVDLVIVAGDTCEGVLRAFEHLRRIVPMHIPIIMVMGNHEYYRRFVPDELELARSQASAFNIYILENDTIVLGGIRVVGATLWTDYRAFGESDVAAVMNACATGMNDHRLIGWQKEPSLRFRPEEAALLHHQSKTYLAEVLATEFAGPTVAISHHAVHWDSVHPRFQSDPVTAAFVSDQSALIEAHQPALWVHGHVHNSSDYRVAKTRIVCNPHGYGSENAEFDGALIVEVGE